MRQVRETLLEMLKEVAKIGKGCAALDASGGVTHEIARAIAETGVDFVSSGALTHSVKVVDLTMEFA
jgi:nicotinate-nucleotide pyrophosphorylase (carboxylating)